MPYRQAGSKLNCLFTRQTNGNAYTKMNISNKKSRYRVAGLCCRGRDRTSTRQLAVAQSSVVDPGRPDFHRNGSMLCLSCDPHPRDKRACLPKISSPHNFKDLVSLLRLSETNLDNSMLC